MCDSTSAPVCSLIPLNAWGALLIGIILEQINTGIITGNATSLFLQSIPYNFYAILTLIFVLYIILSEKDFASMQRAEAKAVPQETAPSQQTGNLWHMLLPLWVLIIMMPIALYFTGIGSKELAEDAAFYQVMMHGSGTTAVFYAVIVSLLFSFFYYLIGKVMSVETWFTQVYKGAGDMLPIVVILVLAFSIGQVTKSLDTGHYLASVAGDSLPIMIIPLLIFILTAIIAFSTGTSWGTFSIMLPIAITFSVATVDVSSSSDYLVLVIAAVVSGGIFGDHCSPISDTTIISSMASQCDHISHVNTQLPYALVTGIASALLFLIAGIVVS